MHIYVGITDDRWFNYLANQSPLPDEVNFWRPKSQDQFRALEPGELFLFKLHSPNNFIVGGGVFAHHKFFPIRLAWDAFQHCNGTPDCRTFLDRIIGYRGAERAHQPLGCTVLTQPFFWPRSLWLPMPSDWPRTGAMEGKRYDTADLVGAKLWADVQARMQSTGSGTLGGVSDSAQDRYGAPRLITPRLGQGAFRFEVTDAYTRRCAITGERTLPALAACHIKPYADFGPHQVNNGLLLRSDLHNLFDLGYLTVTLDHKVKVSRRIREEFENGKHYYAFDDQPLQVLPKLESDLPAREFLEWHNGIFKG
jgi:putative restriction endonuclease